MARLAWIRRKGWPDARSADLRPLSLVDLFCGCGGLTLGVREAARGAERPLDIRLALDCESAPLAVYRDNFGCDDQTALQAPVEELFDGELGAPATVAERRWARRVGRLDVLVAGPPCQGHSDLNNSTRRSDPRNALYLRTVRAVGVLKPKVVIIENVAAVVHDRGGVVGTAVGHLAELGYDVSTGTADVLKFGIPQTRRRHLLVATLKRGFDVHNFLVSVRGPQRTAKHFLSGIEDEPDLYDDAYFQPSRMTQDNRRRVTYLFEKDVYDLPDRLRPSCHRDKPHSYVSMYGRMHWDRPAQTITSGFGSMGQGRFVHPTRPRTLTPHEAARLQGFPDFFSFLAAPGVTALRRMIGNAVPPQVCAVLVSELLRRDFV